MAATIDATGLIEQAVQATLKVLRQQRDDKQTQDLYSNYDFNPQIFQSGNHYIAGPIVFKNPFTRRPIVTFGSYSDIALEDPTIVNHPIATGFTPPIIYPYVYGWQQDAGSVTGFYLGLYALTSIPASVTQYTVSWHAKGKSSPNPQQRVGEAWSSAYNRNEAGYLTNNVSN